MEDDPNLESKLTDLQERIRSLPDNEKEIGQTALELCQQPDITIPDYESQMKAKFPELRNKEETKTYHRGLIITNMMAERIILTRQESEAGQMLQAVGAY